MKLLLVRYGRQLGSDDPEQAGAFLTAAEKIAGLPGLIWKLWSFDDSQHRAESVYLFDSDEHARAWGDEPMRGALSSHPGIGNAGSSSLIRNYLGQAGRGRGGRGLDHRAAHPAAARRARGRRPRARAR